jgi:hypothetical protein
VTGPKKTILLLKLDKDRLTVDFLGMRPDGSVRYLETQSFVRSKADRRTLPESPRFVPPK